MSWNEGWSWRNQIHARIQSDTFSMLQFNPWWITCPFIFVKRGWRITTGYLQLWWLWERSQVDHSKWTGLWKKNGIRIQEPLMRSSLCVGQDAFVFMNFLPIWVGKCMKCMKNIVYHKLHYIIQSWMTNILLKPGWYLIQQIEVMEVPFSIVTMDS